MTLKILLKKICSQKEFFVWHALILTLPCGRELTQLKSNNISATSFPGALFKITQNMLNLFNRSHTNVDEVFVCWHLIQS